MESEHGFSVNTLLCGLLTIAFVILKLTGVIWWSWWWVLAPVWIPFSLGVVLVVVLLILEEKNEKENPEDVFWKAFRENNGRKK